MDSQRVSELLITRREDFSKAFPSGGNAITQTGLGCLYQILDLCESGLQSLPDLFPFLQRLEEKSVYYDLILLKEELDFNECSHEDVAEVIKSFFLASSNVAYGLYSNSDVAQIAKEADANKAVAQEYRFVDIFLLYIAYAFVNKHNETRVTLQKDIAAIIENINAFPENFFYYRRLDKKLASLNEIDSNIMKMGDLERLKSERVYICYGIHNAGVELLNDGRGLRGAVPRHLAKLNRRYFPEIVANEPKFGEEEALIKKAGFRGHMITLAMTVFMLAFIVGPGTENLKSWYYSYVNADSGLLVIKNVGESAGTLLQPGDTILSVNSISRPNLETFREAVQDTKAPIVNLAIDRNGKLLNFDMPYYTDGLGQQRIGVTFYDSAGKKLVWAALFFFVLCFYFVLAAGYWLPYVGIIQPTLALAFCITLLPFVMYLLPFEISSSLSGFSFYNLLFWIGLVCVFLVIKNGFGLLKQWANYIKAT